MVNNKEKFEYILSNIYNLQHYGEAKNGVLLTLLSGVLFLINENNILNEWRLLIFNILITIPIVILLFSFFPKFNKKSFRAEDYNKIDRNRFNILNIQDLSIVPEDLVKERELEKYTKNYELDLQRQISFNSQIAMRKFRSFSFAIVFFGIAMISFVIFIVSV